MFERDKDDLRNLGIEIEVGSFDPLFEDEAGYRIKPDSYQFQLGEVSSQEISLLSLAAEAWRGAALDGSALTALRKLRAIGIESDLESIPELAPHANIADKNLQLAISAINARKRISFQYLSEDLKPQERKIAPYALASEYGYWYLYGSDLDKNSLRSFRLDRISSDIEVDSKSSTFEIPSDFVLTDHMGASGNASVARVYLRTGRALALRTAGKEISSEQQIPGWNLFELKYRDSERLIEELLWYGDDVVLQSPSDLREELVRRLQAGVKIYG